MTHSTDTELDKIIDFVNRHGYTKGDNELRKMIERVVTEARNSERLKFLVSLHDRGLLNEAGEAKLAELQSKEPSND